LRFEYAVFGAVALGLHGLARATADLDLFIRPDADNVERLEAALREVFGDPNFEDITAEDLSGDHTAVLAERFGFREEWHAGHPLPIDRGDATSSRRRAGVERFLSVNEANATPNDPYRR
jgi:hypothetical protein